jgi:hypothetical protein
MTKRKIPLTNDELAAARAVGRQRSSAMAKERMAGWPKVTTTAREALWLRRFDEPGMVVDRWKKVFRRITIVALLMLTGCSSNYEYRQTDDEYGHRKVVTSVTETTDAISSETIGDIAAALFVATLVAVAALGGVK